MIGALKRQSSDTGAAAERCSGNGNGMREPQTPTIADFRVPAGTAGAQPTNPFALLAASLRQLAELLAVTSDEQYIQKPVGVIPSSLGGHVRHCLDHFDALCSGASTGGMDYDDRSRGTMVETDRSAAQQSIRRLQDRVALLDASVLTRTVRVTSMLAGDGTSIEALSSLGRELAFVLSHTVHHNALVAAMCKTLGIPIPERFGYAPSTVAHLDGSACVPSPSSR
ncbi:MAG TPA: DinB family protein [Phycisphaerae bacterium]|nr:DinB family protein [Phycisphaerae bacterium]